MCAHRYYALYGIAEHIHKHVSPLIPCSTSSIGVSAGPYCRESQPRNQSRPNVPPTREGKSGTVTAPQQGDRCAVQLANLRVVCKAIEGVQGARPSLA